MCNTIFPQTHLSSNAVIVACLSIIRFMTAWFIHSSSWSVFRLNLKRTDTTTQRELKKKKWKRQRSTGNRREKEGKTKNGSVLVGLWFSTTFKSDGCFRILSRDEGGTERTLQRERKEKHSSAWRGQQDEQCVHCPCGLLNILMKEPHPDSCHKLHTDSHND